MAPDTQENSGPTWRNARLLGYLTVTATSPLLRFKLHRKVFGGILSGDDVGHAVTATRCKCRMKEESIAMADSGKPHDRPSAMSARMGRRLMRWATAFIPYIAALAGVSACEREYPEDSVPLTATERPIVATYIRLVREQLAAPDPFQTEIAINCEVQRLFFVMDNDSAGALLRRADHTALAGVSRAERDRVSSALAGHMIHGGQGCDSLSRAGVLGGRWPSDSELKAAAQQQRQSDSADVARWRRGMDSATRK